MKSRKLITLEPALEELAADWPAWKRRAFAQKLRRWVRQLEVSAQILEAREQPSAARPLRRLPARKLVRN
jgi:hypothetical protein